MECFIFHTPGLNLAIFFYITAILKTNRPRDTVLVSVCSKLHATAPSLSIDEKFEESVKFIILEKSPILDKLYLSI